MSISILCDIADIPRSSYYKWLHREVPKNEELNEAIAEAVKAIHEECPEKGYRMINDDLLRDYGFHVNDKRVLRICRHLQLKSTIKYHNEGCTISDDASKHRPIGNQQNKYKVNNENRDSSFSTAS